MAIPDRLVRVERSDLFKAAFREVFEKHLTSVKANSPDLREVSKSQTIRYHGDFYGLLKELNIAYDFWWYILRLNDMTSPVEYKGANTFRVPNKGYIESILRNWNNTYA